MKMQDYNQQSSAFQVALVGQDNAHASGRSPHSMDRPAQGGGSGCGPEAMGAMLPPSRRPECVAFLSNRPDFCVTANKVRVLLNASVQIALPKAHAAMVCSSRLPT